MEEVVSFFGIDIPEIIHSFIPLGGRGRELVSFGIWYGHESQPYTIGYANFCFFLSDVLGAVIDIFFLYDGALAASQPLLLTIF